MKFIRKPRREASRKAAKELLAGLASGTAEPYEAYRQLYRIWCGNNSAVQDCGLSFEYLLLSGMDAFR